jgi:hypothetical protein
MAYRSTQNLVRVLAVVGSLTISTLGFAQVNCVTSAPNFPSTYLICVPPGAPSTIDLVVFAHGYVSPTVPAGQIPTDQLSLQGVSIPDLVNRLGFAFAVASYPKNGLAIKEGMADLEKLVQYYKSQGKNPGRVYLVGASEGGLITAKLIEMPGSSFSGGLALCGPVGDFRGQINHFGDMRVVYDYFFPDVLPPTPVSVPTSALTSWGSVLLPAVQSSLTNNPDAMQQLYSVTRTPSDAAQPTDAAIGNLWYNIFATNDATVELGGQPFDNRTRLYFGSKNDFRLNMRVQRFSADPAALLEIQKYYDTTGKLARPLVTMHTTGDPIVPYWHETVYGLKVLFGGGAPRYIHLPVFRYGHCNFQPAEVLLAFALLVGKVSGQSLANAEAALPTESMRQEYRALSREQADLLRAW